MRRQWRLAVLALLVLAPFLFLIGAGSWWLWREGLWFYAWWPLAGSVALAVALGYYWQRKQRLLPGPDFSAPLHWTDRDRQAWLLVEARAKAVKSLPPAKMMEAQFYADLAKEMTLELARCYHPQARDPIGNITIPELLAVMELAAGDLAEMVDDYLPGGHMLTINHWRSAGRIADWYSKARNTYWAISAVFAPITTAVRYAASKIGLSRPLEALQANILGWFYTVFVHRLGTYLIDLNSGRLRVGARRYRELLAQARLQQAATPDGVRPAEPVSAPSPAPPPALDVTITLVGQVKAGKSSLVNALLGEQRAATDVLPLTAEVTRYRLHPQGITNQLVLLDTVGYTHEGPRADKLRQTQEAVQQSDLVLLVMHARDPARQPDAELLDKLRTWFAERPNLKTPRILGVLTHIDLLSPMMEWSPPYDWLHAKRPKEQSIAGAVATVEEQLGQQLVGVIPVCTAEGKKYGMHEWLLPRIVELLDEARAVSFLRCLQAEADTGKVRRVLDQLLQAGRQLWRAAVEGPG